MSAADDAIRKWWLHDRPNIESVLRRAYNVGTLTDAVMKMVHRAMREAFMAGWRSHKVHTEASGEQSSLFSDGGSE